MLRNQLFSQCSLSSDRMKMIGFAGTMITLCVVAAAWQWSPLRHFTEQSSLESLLRLISNGSFGFVFIVAVYVAGGFMMFPIVILIPVTAFLYGPIMGPMYALLGCLISALLCYLLGRRMGAETVHLVAGKKTAYLSRKLSQHGFFMIALLRVLPIAPYTLVNIVAGAFRMRLWDYTAGTVVGLLPGIVIMTFIEYGLERTVYQPDVWNMALLGAGGSLLLLATTWIKQRVTKSALFE